MRTVFALLVALGLFSGPLRAHDLGLAQVELDRTGPGTLQLRAKLSATVDAPSPVLPSACTAQPGITRNAPGNNQLVQWAISCSDNAMPSELTLPWSLQAAMVTQAGPDGQPTSRLVNAGQDGILIALNDPVDETLSFWTVLADYTALGIEHILIGLDHIALLVCLAVLASGWTLVRLATAFTIGHSLTLGLAALDLVRVPTGPMEAVIALSVVYLARDVVLGRRFDRRHTSLLAGIGLIHGLGFASVLGEIGLPANERLSALFGFNLGVEIGQIIVLFALTVTMALLVRIVRIPARTGGLVVGVAIGFIAAFWTLDRIASLA
ncbi:HupE / UreJ protein [Cribrihabitans marinus]|uniref:HupE / UreJ protein n=1 Tax=Cribrihabitans marinus TaxID=1227549 RepID=A0A1H7DT56_9RHOB|nr:HupE/UreJ family protein [Cribrihabitans marinus]GGH40056.1 membrane protein [Cribrihabitans marinus]SEK04708.1 HupE / UreJ protein [Cribrihabitans marinus]